MATATGTIFDSLRDYSTNYSTPASAPAADQGLAGQAAEQNIAAAPDLSTLSDLINQINHTANQNRVTGGAALEAQSSQNIQNELAGILPQSFLDTLQSGMAQRGAAGGFGIDSPNTNAAALRSMGLQTIDLQKQGQQDLTGAYNRAAPLWDVSQGMVTPGLLQQQQDAAAGRALQAQQMANAQQEWQAQLAEQQGEYGQTLAQRQAEYQGTLAEQQSEYAQTLAQNQAQLAAQMGLSYSQLSQAQQQFVDSQAQQMTEWGGSLAEQAAEAQQETAYRQAQLAQQESQFGQTYSLNQAAQAEAQREYDASLANQQSQFGTTSAQQQANLYAQTYGMVPGYNQYGVYTGQTGNLMGGLQPATTTTPAATATTAASIPNSAAFRNLPLDQQFAFINQFTANNPQSIYAGISNLV